MAKPDPAPFAPPAPEPTATVRFDVTGLLADGVVAVRGMPDYERREFTVADGVASVPLAAVRAFRAAFPTATPLD